MPVVSAHLRSLSQPTRRTDNTDLTTVASTRVQGWVGRTTEWGGVWEGTEANWWRLIAEWNRLEAERTEGNQYWSAISESTNNIGGDIPVDPLTKILGDVSPASPAGLTPVPNQNADTYTRPLLLWWVSDRFADNRRGSLHAWNMVNRVTAYTALIPDADSLDWYSGTNDTSLRVNFSKEEKVD